MAEVTEERLEEAPEDEDETPVAEADEEPGCTVEGGLARL